MPQIHSHVVAAVLLLLRVTLGLTLVAHGSRNLLDARRTRSQVERLGLRPRALWLVPARFLKALGGTLMAVGLATPAGGAMIVASMLMAALSKKANGFWTFNDGFEYPMMLAVLAIGLSLAGPGPYSLDAALGLGRFWTTAATAGLLALALATTLAGWITRRAGSPVAAAARTGRSSARRG